MSALTAADTTVRTIFEDDRTQLYTGKAFLVKKQCLHTVLTRKLHALGSCKKQVAEIT